MPVLELQCERVGIIVIRNWGRNSQEMNIHEIQRQNAFLSMNVFLHNVVNFVKMWPRERRVIGSAALMHAVALLVTYVTSGTEPGRSQYHDTDEPLVMLTLKC